MQQGYNGQGGAGRAARRASGASSGVGGQQATFGQRPGGPAGLGAPGGLPESGRHLQVICLWDPHHLVGQKAEGAFISNKE